MKLAHEPASSRPRPCASLKKPHESCPLAAPCGSRRKKNDRGQTSAFPSETTPFTPLILAHRGSALPWLVDNRAALRLRRIWCVPTSGSPRQCSLPLARHHPPEEDQIGGAHLGSPSSANHTAAASQPAGRIAKAVSWLNLSRVSPALHSLERPFISHTHTPKSGFRGRGHYTTTH